MITIDTITPEALRIAIETRAEGLTDDEKALLVKIGHWLHGYALGTRTDRVTNVSAALAHLTDRLWKSDPLGVQVDWEGPNDALRPITAVVVAARGGLKIARRQCPSTSELAALLMVDTCTVRRRCREGILKRSGRGLIDPSSASAALVAVRSERKVERETGGVPALPA